MCHFLFDKTHLGSSAFQFLIVSSCFYAQRKTAKTQSTCSRYKGYSNIYLDYRLGELVFKINASSCSSIYLYRNIVEHYHF